MTRFTSRFIGMIAATAILSIMLVAQPQRMTPQERLDRLTKDLSLTKEQQDTVRSIFTTSQEKMTKMREEHQGDREAMRPLMQKLRQDTDDQLKGVLTAEQFEKYTKMQAERMGQGQGQGRQRPLTPRDTTQQKAAPTPDSTQQAVPKP